MKCIECFNYTVKQHKQTNNVDKVCAANKNDLRLIWDLNPVKCKEYKIKK